MKNKFPLIIIIILMNIQLRANSIERIEPPYWWVGMKNTELQLLVYGKDISNAKLNIDYEGVDIKRIEKVDSPNYLFITLSIAKNTKAGELELVFKQKNSEEEVYKYQLKERKKNSSIREGFSSKDAMYLLMPDRFANGNTENDNVDGMLEKINREALNGRHGGDIEGIIKHLDYLQELGFTALWTTPVMEDNLPEVSYHHYAISNYYKVDARFGTNEDYRRLSAEAKKRGIKLIIDVVTNHCSTAHWWIKDLPTSDWIHQFPKFTRSNYRMSTLTDPHSSLIDKKLNSEGWFDTTMADLNQKNPLVINYFTQLFIWWIEYADLGGLRIDTFPYNDIYAMATFNQRIMEEYPNFNIVGECWQHSPQEISYWQKDAQNYDGYNSQMPTVMDFPFTDAITLAVNEKSGWSSGLSRLYELFTLDYIYPNLNNLLIFLDNHDTERFATSVAQDTAKMNLALTALFTVRGIPQFYYGTELLMGGDKKLNDGDIRRDFPGGWKEDHRNAFTPEGRTKEENKVFNHVKTLLNFRKNATALQTGKMLHYIPENDIYVYFRYDENQRIMIVLNNNNETKMLQNERFSEGLSNYTKARNILTGKMMEIKTKMKVPAKGALVLELLR